MKISIVTPVYNYIRIGRALDSVLAQQHDAQLEIIVVDGGSTDGTLDILEGYRPYLPKLVSEPDNGIYDAMNKGIALATGDVIGILNADDRYHDPTVLRDVLEKFNSGSIDAVYGDLVYVDEERIVRYWRSGRASRAKYYLGWMPPHPAFFLRRSVYEQFGMHIVMGIGSIFAEYCMTVRTAVPCWIMIGAGLGLATCQPLTHRQVAKPIIER